MNSFGSNASKYYTKSRLTWVVCWACPCIYKQKRSHATSHIHFHVHIAHADLYIHTHSQIMVAHFQYSSQSTR
jgi:hypothetical protein